jgi:hypothetical protein
MGGESPALVALTSTWDVDRASIRSGTTPTCGATSAPSGATCRSPRRRARSWTSPRCWSRTVVETDGWSWHRGRASFAGDRARDRRLLRAGLRVARFTHGEICHTPAAVGAELAALLAA